MLVPAPSDQLYAVHIIDGKLRADRVVAFEYVDDDGGWMRTWVACSRGSITSLIDDDIIVVHVDALPPRLRPVSLHEDDLEKLLASKQAA
jgi:hypothetical protein